MCMYLQVMVYNRDGGERTVREARPHPRSIRSNPRPLSSSPLSSIYPYQVLGHTAKSSIARPRELLAIGSSSARGERHMHLLVWVVVVVVVFNQSMHIKRQTITPPL